MTTISNSDLRTYMGVLAATINSNFRKAKQNTPPEIATTISASSTNANPVGAKLFYDTVGNIESALNTINSGV